MGMTYDEAVATLSRSTPSGFVAERKRLAGELKAAGDKDGAKRLEKLARPALSVWAVNQLWWQARADFDELFASAARLRAGDLAATSAHRQVIAALRERAAQVLAEGEHAVSESVLRRVTTTLSALAAQGGFDPDPPGGLAADRDPPGFDAFALAAPQPAAAPKPGGPEPPNRSERAEAAAERLRIEQERQRAEAEQERIRLEHERAKRRAKRQALERELQQARSLIQTRVTDLEHLRATLAAAEQALDRARAAAAELEARLAALGDQDI